MLSYRNVARLGLAALVTVALLSGSLAWAKKPPKDPPTDPPTSPPFVYQITWLTSSLCTPRFAIDINNNGNIVGIASRDGRERAFLYTAGIGVQDLNDLAGPESGWNLYSAYGINDSGQVVGVGTPNGESHSFGFRFTPGDIDGQEPVIERMALPDAVYSVAGAINDLGEVVGESNDAAFNKTVFVYSYSSDLDEWQMTNLGVEPSVNVNHFGINNFGQVVGTTNAVGSVRNMIFRYTPGLGIETTSLFNAPFTAKNGWSWAGDINDAGEITGNAPLAKLNSHAFRFSDLTGMVDLDGSRQNESRGTAINLQGDVAGHRWYRNDNQTRGFLYTDEYGMVDLDDLVVGTPEDLDHWMTRKVNIDAMNDSGQICGGLTGTPAKAFVLTRVPVEN